MSNNRRYPRLNCFVAVELQAKEPDMFALGNLSSVGLGGCGVETDTPLNIGASVEIASIEDEEVRILGEVVNRRILEDKPGFGLGIQFADSVERVTEFIKFVEGKTQVDAQEYWYLKRIKRTEGRTS